MEYLDLESVNGLNLYCYCKNNPIMYTDPSGHIAITSFIIGLVCSAVIGGLVSAGIAAGAAYLSDGDVGVAFWGGFVAGFGGNVLTQSISSYNATGSININIGDALFAGVTNSLVCMATMGSMNLWMSDSFNPALSGKTFGSRFVEFMSFDGANTAASIYFGVMYGMFDGTMSLAKSLIEQSNNKTRNTNALLNY